MNGFCLLCPTSRQLRLPSLCWIAILSVFCAKLGTLSRSEFSFTKPVFLVRSLVLP